MPSPQRKPRVFLSHSKKDVAFIRRLESDLRSAQCEVWIDDIDIRHGRPWLDEIFSAGIPSCEVVLCYITENSLNSQMVQREIDARVVERLANDHVALLLYVESNELRNRLRGDLQTLQIPVLTSENYAEMFPRIVAEIWRTYLESAVAQGIQAEKVRRLELELEFRNLSDSLRADAFSPQENSEFQTIWNHLNRDFRAKVQVTGRGPAATPNSKNILAERVCDIHVGRLFRRAFEDSRIRPSRYTLLRIVGSDLLQHLSLTEDLSDTYADPWIEYESEFLRYGFLHRSALPPRPEADRFLAQCRYSCAYST